MDVLRSTMLAVMAMAALSEIVYLMSGMDKENAGPWMLCGLCCAGCMLGLLSEIIGVLK